MKYESTAFAFPSEYLKYFMRKKAAFFSKIRIKNSPRHGMLRIHGQGCFLYSAGMGCTKDLVERKGFMSSHARIEKSRTNSDSARVRRHSGKKKRNKFLFLICITFTALLLYVAAVKSGRLPAAADLKRRVPINDLDLSPYTKELVELYKRNPEAEAFVLEYPQKKDQATAIDLSEYKNASSVPLLMQWDQRWGYREYSGSLFGLAGCGPTCLSMVSIYLTGDTTMNPAWMADFATQHGYVSDGIGSTWTLFSEGGKKLGLDVVELPLDEQRIVDNLQAGNPIIVAVGKGDFTASGHFIVMTGYQDGKIRINDPNSRANSKKRWAYSDIKNQIMNLWAFRA